MDSKLVYIYRYMYVLIHIHVHRCNNEKVLEWLRYITLLNFISSYLEVSITSPCEKHKKKLIFTSNWKNKSFKQVTLLMKRVDHFQGNWQIFGKFPGNVHSRKLTFPNSGLVG